MNPTFDRIIVLVIDGLGVGAMSDVAQVRPRDIGADTLGHVVRAVGGCRCRIWSAWASARSRRPPDCGSKPTRSPCTRRSRSATRAPTPISATRC